MAKSANASRSLLEIAERYARPGLALDFRLEGLAPGLLMHNSEAMLRMEEAKAAHKEAGKRSKFVPSWAEESEWGCYRLESGVLYLPAKNLLRTVLEAAKAFKMPAPSRSSFAKVAAGATMAPAGVVGWPLLDLGSGEPLREFEVLPMRVVIAKQGVWKARAHLPEWALEGRVELDPEAMPPEVFAEILGHAGSRVGTCEYRPEKGGPYGRFTVKQLEIA